VRARRIPRSYSLASGFCVASLRRLIATSSSFNRTNTVQPESLRVRTPGIAGCERGMGRVRYSLHREIRPREFEQWNTKKVMSPERSEAKGKTFRQLFNAPKPRAES